MVPKFDYGEQPQKLAHLPFITLGPLCIGLLAAVLIGFGAYVLCTNNTNDIGSWGAYGYIFIGAATFVVFIFLNFGAIRENVCCTVTFIILMILVIIVQIGVVYFLTTGRETVASNLSNTLDATWEEELKYPGAMSMYEDWFSCCGRASPQDYIVNERLPPKTCFADGNSNLPENLFESGCRIKLEEYWINLLQIFNILGYILIGLELVVAFISCCLCNSIRNDRRRSFY